MGRVGRIAGTLLVLALCAGGPGCSREKPRAAGTRVAAKYVGTKPFKAASEAVVESPFDAEGRLKPSGARIGWLEIPQGVTLHSSRPGHYFYLGRLPLNALTKFFDARLFTGKVELLAGGTGVRYAAAAAKVAKANDMRFDIQLYASGNKPGEVTVTIDEVPPALTPPISVTDAKSLLRQQQQRAE
jgi:hypothetical protein